VGAGRSAFERAPRRLEIPACHRRGHDRRRYANEAATVGFLVEDREILGHHRVDDARHAFHEERLVVLSEAGEETLGGSCEEARPRQLLDRIHGALEEQTARKAVFSAFDVPARRLWGVLSDPRRFECATVRERAMAAVMERHHGTIGHHVVELGAGRSAPLGEELLVPFRDDDPAFALELGDVGQRTLEARNIGDVGRDEPARAPVERGDARVMVRIDESWQDATVPDVVLDRIRASIFRVDQTPVAPRDRFSVARIHQNMGGHVMSGVIRAGSGTIPYLDNGVRTSSAIARRARSL
jgi:hypothetical protein